MSRLDVCESKVEVTTPFWASNSNGKVIMMIYNDDNNDGSNVMIMIVKVRAILNNKEFEQAVHQEICTYVQ